MSHNIHLIPQGGKVFSWLPYNNILLGGRENVKSGYKREGWEMFYGVGILKSELHHYACYTCFLEIQKKVITRIIKIF